jgi:hypothetical protein
VVKFYTPGMTEAEKADADRQREVDQQFKEMEQWMGVLNARLGVWVRNGPSEALRGQISEAAEEYGARLQAIMGSSPVRLEAPKARNRY